MISAVKPALWVNASMRLFCKSISCSWLWLEPIFNVPLIWFFLNMLTIRQITSSSSSCNQMMQFTEWWRATYTVCNWARLNKETGSCPLMCVFSIILQSIISLYLYHGNLSLFPKSAEKHTVKSETAKMRTMAEHPLHRKSYCSSHCIIYIRYILKYKYVS